MLRKGGLDMINVQAFCDALLASWVTRIQKADPNLQGWVQLAEMFLSTLNESSSNLKFNLDQSVIFKQVDELPHFYRQVIKCYNKAIVGDEVCFQESIMNQPIWANKYISTKIKGRRNILFFRNWIKSGINQVGDLKFRNGILDELDTYQKINFKQNVYCQIIMVKNALYPFRQCINQNKNKHIENNKPLRSKEIYQMLKRKLIAHLDVTHISNYIAQHCDKENELVAFRSKVFSEKEIKLKEFNFKVLHGILPCNSNLFRWRIRSHDTCDVCELPQTIEHLLFRCKYVKPIWDIVNNLFNLRL